MTWNLRAGYQDFVSGSFDLNARAERPRMTREPQKTTLLGAALLYGFSVSRNRTGSPRDGVVSSPCHITLAPRTKVPTGQPVTRTPS